MAPNYKTPASPSRTSFLFFFLLLALFMGSTTVSAQDTDNDGVMDTVDVDDDNDGILDTDDCVIPVANFSFETPAPYAGATNWTTTGSNGAGTHNLEPATNYPAAADGVQFLYINTNNGVVGQVTLNTPYATFSEGGYILTVAVGDGIANSNFRNDAQSILELGYGNDPASFVPIANRVIDGATETLPGTWTDFDVTVDLAAGDPAIGQGILVRITHTGAAGANAGNYDNVRVVLDSDGDGISNCLEVDSDNDGCPDTVEAGHTANGLGQLANNGINPDGSVMPLGTGYTGTTVEVTNGTLQVCDPTYKDFDGDGIPDMADLDDDNDGITDAYECEIPIQNFSFENNPPFSITPPITGWAYTAGINPSGYGTHDLVPGSNYNQAADGNQFAFIHGGGSLQLSDPWATFSESGYILTVAIGDGIDYYLDNYRNDGQTQLELGYDNGGGFVPIGAPTVVEGHQTPNGTWTDFQHLVTVPANSPALGEAIIIRITHTENGVLRQRAGNYDNIRLVLDRDSNGLSNCQQLNSDGDGCGDAAEMGYTVNGDGTIQGSGVNPDGTVTTTQNILGIKPAVLDDTVSGCDIVDLDNDGIPDGDRFFYGAGDSQQFDLDQDNDNDGIRDIDEGCGLASGAARGIYNFEFPTNIFFAGPPFNSAIDYWTQSGTGSGIHLVDLGGGPYAPNYETDGTGLRDIVDDNGNQVITMFNDSYAYLNGNASIVQDINAPVVQANAPTIEEGSYIITLAIGDGLDYEDSGRNDGTSTIEVGYDNGSGFVPLGDLIVEGHETPNGMWTDFSFSVTATPASIGELLLVRISHQENPGLNQQQGNYDYIRIDFDFDGDGLADCDDPDSDDDGCNDVIEAGYIDDDGDGFLGNTVPPTVNGNGLVTSGAGYTTPVNAFVRSPGYVTVNTNLLDTAGCEGQEVTFTVVAAVSGTAQYEWTVSTDGGTTFGAPLVGETANTLTFEPVLADSGNVYRVEVWSDDHLCREESTATLTVNALPATMVPVPQEAAICTGGTAQFNLNGGDPNATVTYTLDGGVTTPTVLLDATGAGSVYHLNTTADLTMEIISIANANCTLVLPTLPDINPAMATITINAEPELTEVNKYCAADLLTYSVDFTFTAGAVTNTTAGTLSATGDSVTDIPAGTDITITVDNNGCMATFIITAQVCSCPFVATPMDANDPESCEGDVNPLLSVVLPPTGLGDQVNWYDVPTGGTALATGVDYTALDTAPGIHTYYAEAEESASGCTSSRIPVTLTISALPVADVLTDVAECESYNLPALSAYNRYFTAPNGGGTQLYPGGTIAQTQTVYILATSPTNSACTDESSFQITINEVPVLTVTDPSCDPSLQTYSVEFSATVGVVSASLGTVSGNRVINIPVGSNVVLTATNQGCMDSVAVISPFCPCPIVSAPVAPNDPFVCEGDQAVLMVEIGAGSVADQINWYTAPVGGSPLASGIGYNAPETIPGTYTYYAEAEQSVSGCTSDRIPVVLNIVAIPAANELDDVDACEVYILPVLGANNTYYTGPNRTGTSLSAGATISQSLHLYIVAEAPNNPNCYSESSFTITLYDIPDLDFQYEGSLCVDANGATQPFLLGEDLGPDYTYDWTPNNDPDGDGIENAVFEVTEAGTYSLELINNLAPGVCATYNSYTATITSVTPPTEVTVDLSLNGYPMNTGNRVTVLATANGQPTENLEYSMDDPNGPYQESNVFENLLGGIHTAYVRHRAGCGTTLASESFLIINYPTMFSPNGDGSNDTWNVLGLENVQYTTKVTIAIMDRYGKMVKQLDPNGAGWDGSYNGSPLPSTDYWFVVDYTDLTQNGKQVRFNGHFSLLR
ncbi:MAG: T9SS type B sorting domain-containing protein [Sediminicola sp.]